MDVRMATVGPFQENSYLLRAGEQATRALFVDPGDEGERLAGMLADTGAELEAILITHCHVDHVGAVAHLARLTGAPVYAPEAEQDWLRDPNTATSLVGLPPMEGWEAEHLVRGGERLELAGYTIAVLATPGHSPGHVTYALEAEGSPVGTVLASGDVLFQGSVGRTDLPGADHGRLLQSIAELAAQFPDETPVLPGHMGVTTLGQEKATNPFLADLPAPR
ncbi:MAG: MBL fold metallo-hydrolase [Solirubrobacterales bacterium]